MNERIKVLVVDDSALIRTLLSEIIGGEADMEVIGTASDPYIARERIKTLNPDVLTLDVEMPRMNGLEFLEKLMRLRPMAVVMVSSVTEAGATATLRALELGAVDFVAKPPPEVKDGLLQLAEELTDKIRAAARARIRRYTGAAPAPEAKLSADAILPRKSGVGYVHDSIIAIGASTGGTEAIKDVLVELPRNAPPIVVTQHMPSGFTRSYAARLDRLCALDVKEAEDGERLLSGRAYIAPGQAHLLVVRRNGTAFTQLNEGPRVGRHRPAVDVLFRSVANTFGPNASAAILTGMGHDGAAGIVELHAAGAFTIAQDEESCIVYGMPKAAVITGSIDVVLPLSGIAHALMHRFRSVHATG